MPPTYGVEVGRRYLLGIAIGGVLALAPVSSAALAQESDVVVFDLSTEHTQTASHSAHLLFNLNTDNIVHPSVSVAWNSMYRTAGSQVTGHVEINVAAGTVSGQLTEQWVCDGNCDELDGETYADEMNAGWTATIAASLEASGQQGNFVGTVDLSYSVDVSYAETPSTCGDEICYICKNEICEFTETMTGTATVEGLWDGETLVLAYADRLEADANDMDFDGLRDVQFIMGRAEITLSGTEPAVIEPPPDETPPAEPEEAPADEPEEPPVEADSSAAQPEPATETDATPSGADSATDEGADKPEGEAVAPSTDDGDKGGISKIGLLVASIILMLLLFGYGFVKQMMRLFSNTGNTVEESEHAAMFSPSLLTADPGLSPPAEGALDPPSPPPPSAGAEVTRFKRTPDEMGAGPAYMLQATDGLSYVEGTRGIRVITYADGSLVDVVRRAGNSIQVRVGDHPPVWIDKKNLKYLRR